MTTTGSEAISVSAENDKFSVVIPASLSKSDDGDWIVQGLASTASRDKQGEVIEPEGLDLSPVDQKKGVLNWDHAKGPENTVGLIDSYSRSNAGLFIKGRLFKNHSKAKAIQEIMSSLKDTDAGRMGLSVEGVVLERGGADGKTIKKCRINAVALTMNPVNTQTYVDLAKSMTEADVSFEADGTSLQTTEPTTQRTFTAQEVVSLLEKALTVTSARAEVPSSQLSGGDALTVSNISEPPRKKKKTERAERYEEGLKTLMKRMKELHPGVSEDVLWSAVKARSASRLNLDV